MDRNGPITYHVVPCYRKFNIEMNDPVFGHPWYVRKYYNGKYDWTSDATYAKDFSKETALRHKRALDSGADTEWAWYHNHWKEYWEELERRKMS